MNKAVMLLLFLLALVGLSYIIGWITRLLSRLIETQTENLEKYDYSRLYYYFCFAIDLMWRFFFLLSIIVFTSYLFLLAEDAHNKLFIKRNIGNIKAEWQKSIEKYNNVTPKSRFQLEREKIIDKYEGELIWSDPQVKKEKYTLRMAFNRNSKKIASVSGIVLFIAVLIVKIIYSLY